MKKFIIISCIALAGLGCKTANLQSNYSNLSRDVLEEKTIAGDLQAAFWLGDDYFLGKNEIVSDSLLSLFFIASLCPYKSKLYFPI